jgi:hypothetical protein
MVAICVKIIAVKAILSFRGVDELLTAVVYLLSDLSEKFSTRYPHIMLLNIRQFGANRRRDDRTFLGGRK